MGTISSGSVTFTVAVGETYNVTATGEAYIDIGGGSTQSFRLVAPTLTKTVGNFIVPTPVTIRVISGSVEYTTDRVNVVQGRFDENGRFVAIVNDDATDASVGGVNTTGLSKPWPSAGSNISQVVIESSSNVGTTYGKLKMSGRVKSIRPLLTSTILRSGDAYSQSGTAVTVNTVYTGGLSAGDKIYVLPTSGNAIRGWYIIASISAGVSYTYTALDSQTTSGNAAWSKPIEGVKVAVALTESSANETSDNLYSPTVGGITYNSAYSSSNLYGWHTADFAKTYFDNVSVLGGANACKVLSASNVIPSFGECGQWIGLPNVPSDDGLGSNLLYRIYHDVQTSGTHSALSGADLFKINSAIYQDALNVDGFDWWRTNFQTFRSGVDGIATLTTLPTSTIPSTGFYIAFEVEYYNNATSVVFVGDSTTAHGKYEFDYGPTNTFTANISGTTLTLTSNVTSSAPGAGSTPYPIADGQPLSFSGSVNNDDSSTLCITGLVSGTNGVSGAVYSLSKTQSTASGVTVTLSPNQIQGWASWCVQACNAASTVDNPIECYNGGMASKSSREYIGQLLSMLATGIVPDVVWIQGYSVNDSGSPTDFNVSENQGEILQVIDACRKAGVRKILVSTWPLTASIAANTGLNARMTAHNNWIRDLARNGVTDGCPDFEAIRQKMGTSAFYSPDGSETYASFGDGIHMGRAAVAAMKAEIRGFI